MATTIPCTRCGKLTAYTDADYAALAAKGGPVLPSGVCFPCAWREPALQPALRDYAERKKAETIRRGRELLARPLERTARVVEGRRSPGTPHTRCERSTQLTRGA